MTYYSFWQPSYSGELYHYGVIGMKWGVHKFKRGWAKYDREKALAEKAPDDKGFAKHQIRAEKAMRSAAKAQHTVTRKSEAKLAKLDRKYQKKQAKADKYFAKGERKANSLFGSKRAADRAFRKATKKQFKANKVANKGKRWYERMEKTYKKAGWDLPDSSRKTGEEFIRQVRANSRAMYAASYVGG